MALDGAWLRYIRADRHLAEARGLIQKFGKSCVNHIVADNDTDPNPSIILRTTPDLPPFLPIVVSDVIHNLRAALDYVVFELAFHDSGRVQDGTQFLIEDFKIHPTDPRLGFDGKRRQRLKGLSPKHVGMIEALQPYKGVDWTKTLRNISNPDKHRKLTALSDSGYYTMTHVGQTRLETKPLVIKPDDWEVDASYAIYIAPPNLNEPSLMPTLDNVYAGVGRTLELFKREF